MSAGVHGEREVLDVTCVWRFKLGPPVGDIWGVGRRSLRRKGPGIHNESSRVREVNIVLFCEPPVVERSKGDGSSWGAGTVQSGKGVVLHVECILSVPTCCVGSWMSHTPSQMPLVLLRTDSALSCCRLGYGTTSSSWCPPREVSDVRFALRPARDSES